MKKELTRRDFLANGLALAGAAAAVAAASTGTAYARGQEQEKKDKKNEEKEKEKEPNYDDLFDEDSSSGEEDTRACPQCGALMYRQGRTWTCENCGYSYVE